MWFPIADDRRHQLSLNTLCMPAVVFSALSKPSKDGGLLFVDTHWCFWIGVMIGPSRLLSVEKAALK